MSQNSDPVQRLAEQAAIARAQAQQSRVKQQRYAAQTNPHCVSLGYDAESGLEIVGYPDGSTQLSQPLTDGARSAGDTLLLHQGEGRVTIDAPRAVRRPSSKPKPRLVEVTYPLKILFSVVESGVRNFYIGGDRATPKKIFSLPSTIESYTASITNTGKNNQDWIAGFRYTQDGITTTSKNIDGRDKTNQDNNWQEKRPDLTAWVWRQWGFWTYPQTAPLPSLKAGTLTTQIKYDYHNSHYAYYTIDDLDYQFTTNSVYGQNFSEGVRVYNVPTTNDQCVNFALDTNHIEDIAAINITEPDGSYLTFFPGSVSGRFCFVGVGFFQGVGLELPTTNASVRASSEWVKKEIHLSFDESINDATGTGIEKLQNVLVGQGDILGDPVDNISNSFNMGEVVINGTIKHKGRLNNQVFEKTGTTKYYDKGVSASRSKQPAGREEITLFSYQGSHSAQETKIESILLPKGAKTISEPNDSLMANNQRQYSLFNKRVSSTKSTTTTLISKDFRFAVVQDFNYLENTVFESGVQTTSTFDYYTKYYIYEITGQKKLINDPFASTANAYEPNTDIDSLIETKEKLQIYRLSLTTLEAVKSSNATVLPEIFTLSDNGTGYDLVKSSSPTSVKLASLRVEQSDSTFLLHSVSYQST